MVVFCGGVFAVFCGGVLVVFLWWWSGVLEVVFLWWCFQTSPKVLLK